MVKRILMFVFTVIVVSIIGGLSFLCFRKPAQAPVSPARVPMTPERIARGKYLFEHVADCGRCHSERDFGRVGGPLVPGGEGYGNIVSTFLHGMPGVVVASNITPDVETGIGSWSDGEKIRAIREGVDRDGNALLLMMPYTDYRLMSDMDVESVVAYLNSSAPIRHALPKTRVDFPINLLIKSVPRPVGHVAPPESSDPQKYGKYLATLAGCGGCHTPKRKGRRLAGMDFAGGEIIATQAGSVVTANITQDLDTGIGKWSPEFFQKKIYEYKDYAEHGSPPMAGPESFTLMPWLAFSGLTPEDLGAIYVFLRSVKPVRHLVETHPSFPGS